MQNLRYIPDNNRSSPLPEATKEWHYSFKTRRDLQSEQTLRTSIKLVTEIAALLASSSTAGTSLKFAGLAESSIKSIVITKGDDQIYSYAFEPFGVMNFTDNKPFVPLPASSNISQNEGNSITKSYNTGTIYIGLDSRNFRTGVWLDVEVVATVLERQEIRQSERTKIPLRKAQDQMVLLLKT